MKKLINSMLSMLAIAGVLFLASCGDDEEDPAPNGPTVGLVNSTGNISGDAELLVNSTFSIEVTASEGDRRMDTWSILRDGVALANFDGLDVPENDNFTTVIADIPVLAEPRAYTYSFQVTDRDGVTGSVTWIITAVEPTEFTTFDNVQLGGQSNATFGSFFKAEDGSVLFLSAANSSNGADVDFFYYNGATNGPTLFSPTDPDAGSLFSGAVDAWTTKNDTKISSSNLDFDTATPADLAAETVSGTKANQLAADDVVVFETAGGIKGMLKVTSLATGNDGSITFDAKVIN